MRLVLLLKCGLLLALAAASLAAPTGGLEPHSSPASESPPNYWDKRIHRLTTKGGKPFRITFRAEVPKNLDEPIMGNIIDIVNYLTSTLDKDLGKLVELKKIIMDSEPESELYVFGLGPHHPDGHVTFSFNKPISVGSWSITKDGYNSKDVATAHLENIPATTATGTAPATGECTVTFQKDDKKTVYPINYPLVEGKAWPWDGTIQRNPVPVKPLLSNANTGDKYVPPHLRSQNHGDLGHLPEASTGGGVYRPPHMRGSSDSASEHLPKPATGTGTTTGTTSVSTTGKYIPPAKRAKRQPG